MASRAYLARHLTGDAARSLKVRRERLLHNCGLASSASLKGRCQRRIMAIVRDHGEEEAQMPDSTYTIASDLLRSEPDLHPFIIALYQFGAAPVPAGGEFWGSSLLNRVQHHDAWAGQRPRRLARLGLLRKVAQSKNGACYAVVDPSELRRVLIDHGLDPLKKLPGDFFNHVAKIAS
jgi:hypothetical protein